MIAALFFLFMGASLISRCSFSAALQMVVDASRNVGSDTITPVGLISVAAKQSTAWNMRAVMKG